MTAEFEVELGSYYGRDYILQCRSTPGFNDPADWAAVVYYEATNGERIQVVRIDTSDGYTHMDQLYREVNEKPSFDGGLWDAVAHLKANWRTYAESHEQL